MTIKESAEQYLDYGIAIRRAIHQRPELSQKEFETAKLIEVELDKLGIEHKRFGATSVVAVIEGNNAGKTVALRADMDALPVQEETKAPYSSQVPGVMHACGHDAHVASLLCAAHILMKQKNDIHGTVKLLFQSAEEMGVGAKELVELGAIDDVDAVFGIHIWAEVEHGKVYISAGEQMASSIEFRVKITGRGGHGAMSYQAVDTIVPLSNLVMSLQSITSMEMSALSDVTITVGRVYSGSNAFVRHGDAFNIVAGESYLEGTARTFNETDTELIREKLARITKGIGVQYGVDADFFFSVHALPVINDEKMAQCAVQSVCSLWGEDALDHTLGKSMSSEDFAFYRKKAPSLLAFVGGRNEDKLPCYPHHNCRFDIDESSIGQAAGLYAQFALDYLKGQ